MSRRTKWKYEKLFTIYALVGLGVGYVSIRNYELSTIVPGAYNARDAVPAVAGAILKGVAR